MDGVFKHNDYKVFIREHCAEKSLTFASVADAARIHRQYLTQVLRHKAHLNDEQAFLVGDFLGLTGEALDYFLLLVQEGKAGGRAQDYFAAKRRAIQEARRKAGADLDAATVVVSPPPDHLLAEYYLDVSLQVCHAHLFVPAFQKDMPALAAKLRVPAATLAAQVAKLQAMGLVERVGNGWRARTSLLHLDRQSALSVQNHRNWRIHAAHVPLGRGDDDSFFFTSTVISETHVRQALVAQLRKLVAQFHKSLSSTKDEQVFQVNMDVYGL